MDTTQPIPKEVNENFFELHEQYLARAKSGPIGLLFLGDSITRQWVNVTHIWEHYYGQYHPASFGIGGDQTQHVIWRIANGELDGITPKVVVLLIGTNNCGSNTADEISAGVQKIISLIHEKIPATKVLALGTLPRGPRINVDGTPDNWESHMEKIRAINADLAHLDNGGNIRHLDITKDLTNKDGTIPEIIMPDQVHLTAAGYQLWADAMQPLLDEMLDD